MPKGNPTAEKGVFPHKFTTEEARKGAARSAEVRREKAKSFSERLRDRLEAIEDELVTSTMEQAKSDFRALMALYDRAYGTPAKMEPDKLELDIGTAEARGTALGALLDVSQSGDITGSNGDSPVEPQT